MVRNYRVMLGYTETRQMKDGIEESEKKSVARQRQGKQFSLVQNNEATTDECLEA